MDSTLPPAPAPAPKPLAIALALAAVYLIWGSTYLDIRFALEGGFTPFLLGGIRFLIAGGLMFAFLRLRGEAAPTRTQTVQAPQAAGKADGTRSAQNGTDTPQSKDTLASLMRELVSMEGAKTGE